MRTNSEDCTKDTSTAWAFLLTGLISLALAQIAEYNCTMVRPANRRYKLVRVNIREQYSGFPGPRTLNVLLRQAQIKPSSFGTWKQGKLSRAGDLEEKEMSA